MAGCILVGGRSRRLGQPKALLRLGQQKLLEYVVAALLRIYPSSQILLITPRPEEVAFLGLACVHTEAKDKGPLAALIEALRQTPDEHNLIVACDLPFLSSEVLALLLSRLPGQLAVVPEIGGYLEPLCAAYAKSSLPILERQLGQGIFSLQRAVLQLDPLRLPEQTVRLVDPDLRSFFNVNTSEDLAQARKLLIGRL